MQKNNIVWVMSARKLLLFVIILLLILIGYKVYERLSYEYRVKKALELLKNQPIIDIDFSQKPIFIKRI